MSRKVLAIDIQQGAVSAVLVKTGIKGSWVDAHAYIPPHPAEGDAPPLLAALPAIMERMDITGAGCVVSLPANEVSFRNLRVPFKDARKIRQILPFELEPTLPFAVDDLVMDFQPIKLPDASDQTRIIAAAIDRSALTSCLDMLSGHKLDPQIVAPAGFHTALYLSKYSDCPEHWIFLDIIDDKCTVYIIVSGEVCLARCFSIRSAPESRPGELCIHIQRVLAGFEEIAGLDFQPDEIHVAGYGGRDIAFEQEAKRRLGLPVKRLDLARETNITFKTRPADDREFLHMHNALALALSEVERLGGLNFRSGAASPTHKWAEHKKEFIQTGIILLLVLIAMGANLTVESGAREKQLAGLERQITDIFKTTFPEKKTIVNPVRQMETAMEELKKTSMVPGETLRSVPAIDILNDVSSRIPETIDVELTRMVIAGDHVMISGDTNTNNAVGEMQGKLETSDLYKKVTIISTNKRRDGRIQFKIKADL